MWVASRCLGCALLRNSVCVGAVGFSLFFADGAADACVNPCGWYLGTLGCALLRISVHVGALGFSLLIGRRRGCVR